MLITIAELELHPVDFQEDYPPDAIDLGPDARQVALLKTSGRVQLVEVTIDSLAEVGYVGTTLAEIARRAGVSPGLVAHYFDDKDGLLEAAFRTLARTLAVRMRARLALARTPRGRVQAVIDTNLAPEEFDKRTGTAWLAFWGQVLHVRGLKRVQTAYQRRMLSNLRNDLRRMISGEDARSMLWNWASVASTPVFTASGPRQLRSNASSPCPKESSYSSPMK